MPLLLVYPCFSPVAGGSLPMLLLLVCPCFSLSPVDLYPCHCCSSARASPLLLPHRWWISTHAAAARLPALVPVLVLRCPAPCAAARAPPMAFYSGKLLHPGDGTRYGSTSTSQRRAACSNDSSAGWQAQTAPAPNTRSVSPSWSSRRRTADRLKKPSFMVGNEEAAAWHGGSKAKVAWDGEGGGAGGVLLEEKHATWGRRSGGGEERCGAAISRERTGKRARKKVDFGFGR